MIIELNKFYQYLIGEIPSKLKDETLLKFFFCDPVTTNQNENTIPPLNDGDKLKFRAALRALSATELEKRLYGNSTDQLEEKYAFPDDQQIRVYFDNQEADYQYFAESKTAYDTFKKCFTVCKLVADIIEKNNEADDSIAIIHAYKITVLFGDDPANTLKAFDHYLQSFNFYKQKHPVHDALTDPIPKKTETNHFDLTAWRKLIKTNPKALRLFNMANKIEKQLNSPPQNYSEALEAAKQTSYTNRESYPELADLCFHHFVDEDVFNQCLQIKNRLKTKDNLPGITVDGEEINLPGYHLVKLPIHDPNAYILGYVTNCCQSIGGYSEQCVIDGLTKASNGFYVLLKEKRPGSKKPPFEEKDQINYNDFDIAGQGYAWLSTHENLTFDSWENRTPDRDDVVAVNMLTQFAKKVTHEANAKILRVTIGRGGKTPRSFEQNGEVRSPEIMLEGTPYGDATLQWLLYCNDVRKQELFARQRKIIAESIKYNEEQKNSDIEKQLDILTHWILVDSIKVSKDIAFITERSWYVDEMFRCLATKDLNSEIYSDEVVKQSAYSILKFFMTKYYYNGGLYKDNDGLKLHENLKALVYLVNNQDDESHVYQIFWRLKKFNLDNDKKLLDWLLKSSVKPYYINCDSFFEDYLMLNALNPKRTEAILSSLYPKGWGYYVSDASKRLKNYSKACLKLEEMKLDTNEKLKSYLEYAICRSHEVMPLELLKTLEKAFAKLKDTPLENNEEVRNFLLEKPESSLKAAKELAKLSKLTMDNKHYTELYKCILKNHYSYRIEDILLNYGKLCEHKLEQDDFLRPFILEDSQVDKNIQAYCKFNTLGLENIQEIKKFLTKNTYLGNFLYFHCLVDAFEVLKNHKIEINEFILIAITRCFSSQASAKELAYFFVQLNQINLLHMLGAKEDNIIKSIAHDCREEILKNVDGVVVKLKAIKMEHDWEFVSYVFTKLNSSKEPNLPQLDKVFSWFEQIKKSHLECDPDVRRFFFNEKRTESDKDSVILALTKLTSQEIVINPNIKSMLLSNPKSAATYAQNLIMAKASNMGLFSAEVQKRINDEKVNEVKLTLCVKKDA